MTKTALLLLFYSTLSISSALIVQKECSPELRNPPAGECPPTPDFVCAYFTGHKCDSDLCQKIALTPCHACQDPLVQYYTEGTCQSQKLYCDDKGQGLFPCDFDGNRDVCGYTIKDCLEPDCAAGRSSECDVCNDPKIVYYKPGVCNDDDRVSVCAEFCNEYSGIPICLFKNGCQGDDCVQTYLDDCTGCQEYPGSKYKQGPCQKDRVQCDAVPDTQNCQDAGSYPVCAYFKQISEWGYYNLYSTTVDNACFACQDPTVKYYTIGQCEPVPSDDSRYCLPSRIPRECEDTGEVMCGLEVYHGSGFALDEFSSGCSACQNPNITFYRPGICIYQCPSYEYLGTGTVNCNGSLIDPICVFVEVFDFELEDSGTENEEEALSSAGQDLILVINSVRYRIFSVKNSCVACFDLPSLEYGFYTKGLCPWDQGIRCAHEGTSFYYGAISPVCGMTVEDCSDSSCRTTFAEPLAACNYSSSVMYTPGYCPGDQGISCELYRSQFETICDGIDDFSTPVCGYTRADCEDDSCRADYKNQCYACLESEVVFFTGGTCTKESG